MAKELIKKVKKMLNMARRKKTQEAVAEKEENKKSGKRVSTKKQIEELQQQVAESKDKYLRLFAEFENYKKRNIRERLELMRTAAEETITKILPVLDDFDRAKKSAEEETSTEHFSEGVLLVYNKLYSVLTSSGLEPMESTGEIFDPEVHEAITELPVTKEDQKGKIIDTVEKGYKLNDKIIRFAKVVVGK